MTENTTCTYGPGGNFISRPLLGFNSTFAVVMTSSPSLRIPSDASAARFTKSQSICFRIGSDARQVRIKLGSQNEFVADDRPYARSDLAEDRIQVYESTHLLSRLAQTASFRQPRLISDCRIEEANKGANC